VQRVHDTGRDVEEIDVVDVCVDRRVDRIGELPLPAEAGSRLPDGSRAGSGRTQHQEVDGGRPPAATRSNAEAETTIGRAAGDQPVGLRGKVEAQRSPGVSGRGAQGGEIEPATLVPVADLESPAVAASRGDSDVDLDRGPGEIGWVEPLREADGDLGDEAISLRLQEEIGGRIVVAGELIQYAQRGRGSHDETA
jgi:hypothetical protein